MPWNKETKPIQSVRPNLLIDNFVLLHDNSLPHTSVKTSEIIASFRSTTLPHLPYSPDLAPPDYHLFGPMNKGLRGKHCVSEDVVKTAVMKWIKEQSTVFFRQGYMVSFQGGTFRLRETVTMLRSRNVILWGSVSFRRRIHVLVLVIIPVQKKKALLFDFPSYIYIYIWICVKDPWKFSCVSVSMTFVTASFISSNVS